MATDSECQWPDYILWSNDLIGTPESGEFRLCQDHLSELNETEFALGDAVSKEQGDD